MNSRTSFCARWAWVLAYAAGMAWVESAVVYYLRTMVGRLEPYQPNPLPLIGGLGPVELAREAATLLMLFTVGGLAGRSWRARFGYAAGAFGVWDILYYVFLKIMCGWPHSLFDWDVLFLLPLPWWGPVWAPVSISLLMITWGLLASRADHRPPGVSPQDSEPVERFGGWNREWLPWGLNFLGIGLALYVFMQDTLAASDGGVEAVRKVLPEHFHWVPFGVALALMAAPIVAEFRGHGPRSRPARQTNDRSAAPPWAVPGLRDKTP